MPTFGYGWRVLFPIYAAVCLLSVAILGATPIEEEKQDKASGVGACLKLLGRPFILLCFLGIMCHVGIDVGTNTTAPKLIIDRLGLSIEEAGFATSVYFIFRTIGCFSGAFILRYVAARKFFAVSVAMMLVAMVALFFSSSLWALNACVALIGFGNSNIFSIVFSQALLDTPEEKNAVSGLMIMGLFGGTIFPLAMGFASDSMGSQNGAVAVMLVGVAYLLLYTFKIKKS
jgi:fucose permease